MFKKEKSKVLDVGSDVFNEGCWVRPYTCECGALIYLSNTGDSRGSCNRWYRSIPTLVHDVHGSARGKIVIQQLELTEDELVKIVSELTAN